MANITIDVEVDFTGVTWNPPTNGGDPSWSATPTWIVPDERVSQPSVITWALKPTNVPPGLRAIFAIGDPNSPNYDMVNPVQFLNPVPPGPMLWPYNQPVRVDDATVTVTDDFKPDPNNPAGKYEYYIWVVLAAADGTHRMPQFHLDPDIENKGGQKFTVTVEPSAS